MSDTYSIRQGEELDVEKLAAYLHEHLPELTGEIEISQFPAGASNLTYCVAVGGQEYVLRRPPFGNQVKSAHDMSREFNVLEKLSKVYQPAPKPLVYCADESIIGSPFYLMERRTGLIIRGQAPPELVASTSLQREVCANFIENLVKLHSLDYQQAGLGDLGKPEGYARRQVEGWSKRYFNAKTDDWTELEKVIEWLNADIPETGQASLVHNDYKFDNIMLDPFDLTKIVAVLDWEMTTIGAPLMDFGTTLGYWMAKEAGEFMLNAPYNPRIMMENISRLELAEMYAEKSGVDLSNILYYYVFGAFKIAVIAQQIYYRYAKGYTQDERFAVFNRSVEILGKLAWAAIERKTI